MAKDFSKLIGRIHEKFASRTAFCKAIGRTPEWLSRRLNNQTEFGSDDIILIADVLEINPVEISLYFLTPKFDKIEH